MLQVYVLKNVKVGFWNPPTFSPADKENTKQGLYRHCVMEPVEAKKAHLDECELYHLGMYDENRGEFILNDMPDFIVDCKEFFRE